MEPEISLPEEITLSPKKAKKNLLWLWIIITAIVAAGGVAAFAYRGEIKDKFWPAKETENSTPAPASESAADDSTAPAASTSIKLVDQGVTWLTSSVKLADLGLFKNVRNADFDGYEGTDYYRVATTSDGGEIILAVVKVANIRVFNDFHHFLKKDNKYYWLSQNSDNVDSNYYARTNADTNSTLILSSLLLDKTIIKGSTKMTQETSSSRLDVFVQSASTGTKVEETKWGDLYLLTGADINDKANGSTKIAQYYILRNDGIKMIYHPEPAFRGDDGVLNVTWSGSVGPGQKFSQIQTAGCGASGGSFPLVADTATLQTKTQVASTADGVKIYTVSADSVLAEFAYQVYLIDGMNPKATKAVMLADMGLIVFQDGYGNWVAYMNNTYAPQVECGKPVIYLYPEKNTEVSVKVGADITKSDPEYGLGWKVLASPSGKLIMGDKTYNSLFWEGTGFGSYPTITSGTVVAKADVSATISSQLSGMGLNSKEIADFKDFWIPRMPSAPFVRLSWLTTEQMNVLAPLKVSPKPDSMIRVFLDFAGTQSKSAITPQILPHYERNGFTLVEWGGLLAGNK